MNNNLSGNRSGFVPGTGTGFPKTRPPKIHAPKNGFSGGNFLKKGLLFILPGFAGFAVFYLWPFLISLRYSVWSKPVNGVFVGLKNYIELFQSAPYLLGLRNTALFITICVPVNMALALVVAMLIRKSGIKSSGFVLIFLIPLVIPSGSMAFFWKTLFANDGVINGLLAAMQIGRVKWLESGASRVVILLAFTWKNMGYNMVLFLAGLSNIPKEYYEAASVDGATAWQKFLHITAVCLAPTMILTLLMSIINSFKVFREVYMIMGSYPHDSVYMLQHFMNNVFYSLNYQRLTTATTILVVLVVLVTQTLFRLEKRFSDE